jgi:DNA-binding beta-propeller fold protein YncE
MGLKSRCRGWRPLVMAVAGGGVLAAILAAVPLASGPSALARPVSRAFAVSRPDPLVHAPRFRRTLGPQTLMQPAGVAVDRAGGVWVADTGHDRVVEFSSAGRVLAAFGNLNQPAGIAADAGGHVWVADTGRDRVVEFSSAGRMLAAFGSAGSGRGQLNHPVALAVTPFGDVWVADQGNGRVVEFSAVGRYRVSFTVPAPSGVALDARGDVWVSSPGYALAGGNSVREYSPAGHQLRSFGVTQAGYGDLSDPGSVAVGPGGRIYVAQPDYGLVSVFSPAGSFYTEFGLQPDPRRA